MLKVNYENHIFLDVKPDRTFTMKTKIQKCLILAIILGTSSLIADAADWTNWNNGQSIGSFYAVAGTAKETVAVGIDGRIATRNNTTGIWTTQTFTNAPDFQAMVRAIRHAKNPFAGDPDPDFRAIVYAKSQYVVVREMGHIMTSPDGLKWTRRTSVTTRNNIIQPGRHQMDQPQFQMPNKLLQFQLLRDALRRRRE